MECKICGKSDEEIELFEGIFEEKIESVCMSCAHAENIPLIQKPIFEEEKKEGLSVRERMERLSNPKKPIPKEQFIAHKNLAKLRFPIKREDHQDLIENYDWVLKTARRRKKLSQVQLAEELIIPLQVIMDLESGKIAKEFQNYLDKLESFLGVRIKKSIKKNSEILDKRPSNPEEEKRVIEETKENMRRNPIDINEDKELDLSDKEKLKKWTLRDLINLKRRKQKDELLKAEKSEIIGNELELEE